MAKYLQKKNILYLLLFGCVILLVSLYIHNFIKYPLVKSFDGRGHLQYIDFLRENIRVPLPNEGWELYQPPLYYFLVSLLPGYLGVKIVNFLGLILLCFLVIKLGSFGGKRRFLFVKNLEMIILTLALPLSAYASLQAGNEFFSAVMISSALVYYLINLDKIQTNLKNQIFLGILLGLSLLSKATGWVLVFSIFVHQIISIKGNFKKTVWLLTKIFIVVLAVAGWFYGRNLVEFGNPLVSSVDFEEYKFVQLPGKRDVDFFFNLKPLYSLDLYRAHWKSLWGGIYFTWFYDGHNAVVPITDFSKAGIVLILLSVPLFISFMIELFKHFKNRSNFSIMSIYTACLFVAFVLYNLKLPFYSTVKSLFMYSLIVPYVYFVQKIMEEKIKPINRAVYLLLYVSILVWHFWINTDWYLHITG